MNTFGVYPSTGSEMGRTPIAVALHMNTNDYDSSTLSCKFGETTWPMLQGLEIDAELERITLLAMGLLYRTIHRSTFLVGFYHALPLKNQNHYWSSRTLVRFCRYT